MINPIPRCKGRTDLATLMKSLRRDDHPKELLCGGGHRLEDQRGPGPVDGHRGPSSHVGPGQSPVRRLVTRPFRAGEPGRRVAGTASQHAEQSRAGCGGAAR